ncbi:MAG: ABC1 kinase family protein [Bacilli bacterium]
MFRQIWRSSRVFLLALSFIGYYWQMRFIHRFRSGRRRELEARVYARAGARVRRSALRLQGLIVKVGQFLSARADVLPLSFTRELTQLQDSVPGAPYHKIRAEIEREFGADLNALFTSFAQEATAAASLGQVHRATLSDGRDVAVKVLRPGIERLAAADLSALQKITWVLQHFTKFGRRLQLVEIYREFSRSVTNELDYRVESDFLRRFRKQFEKDRDIVVPAVVDQLVTRSVLVMEYIEGAKVTDSRQLSAWHIQAPVIVERLLDSYLRQLLEFGLVHVDPHPGNLLVLPDGRLCFLDFGMMAEVPSSDVQTFAKLVQSAVTRNLDGIVDAVDKLGFLQPHANRVILKRAIGMMLDRLSGFQLAKGPELDQFIEDFQTFLLDEPLVLQAKYLFIGRAIGMLSGLLTTLQPTIDWWTLLKERALPLLNASANRRGDQSNWRASAREAVQRLFGDKGAVAFDVILDQAQESGLAMLRIPSELDRVLQKVERNELTIQLELQAALVRIDRQQRLLTRLLWIVLFGVTAAFGLWLQAHRLLVETDAAFALSGLFLLAALLSGAGRSRMRR